MDMSGEYRIPAPREKVWAALNDPATLKASLPGCESLERSGDNQFAATVIAKVGPVKAKFNGNVALTNLNPPESYTIAGEGKGGAAGFAKGGADVRLTADGEDITVLRYTAKADVGGKLAQLGSQADRRHGQEDGRRVLRQLLQAGRRPAAAAGARARRAAGAAARARARPRQRPRRAPAEQVRLGRRRDHPADDPRPAVPLSAPPSRSGPASASRSTGR